MSQINTKRVVKNSIVLYFRVLLTLVLSLFTTRIVLQALGVEDYGVYNVVGGFVALFTILSNTLAAATSRFITYELGNEKSGRVSVIFKTTRLIMVIIAGIIILLAETVGLWFVNAKLNIPASQIGAANWVYQLSLASLIINIISVSYGALIIGHEKMSVFAYVGIGTALAKLGGALILLALPIHRLMAYAWLLLIIELTVRIFYTFYCRHTFDFLRIKTRYDFRILKKIFAFSGWNFIGSGAGIIRDQGINILLNIFFSTIVNAARGIALQVIGAVTTFYTSFLMALNPQITKSFAAGEKDGCLKLAINGSRFGYLMTFLIGLPLLLETPFVLRLWLGEIPEYSVVFVRILLITALVDSLSSTLMTLALATGDIAKYQLVIGGLNLLIVPTIYIVLKLGGNPQSALIVSLIFSVLALGVRLIILKDLAGLSLRYYFNSVILKVGIVTIVASVIPYITYRHFYLENLPNALIVIIISIVSTLVGILTIGLSRSERDMVLMKAKTIILNQR